MNENITSSEISFTPVDNHRLMNLCGRFDEHLRQIEKRLGVEIHNRGSEFQVLGQKQAVDLTHHLITQLYAQTKTGEELTPAKVHLLLQEVSQNLENKPSHNTPAAPSTPHKSNTSHKSNSGSDTTIKTPKSTVKPHTKNQGLYIKNIMSNDIIFGIGPAGTGKTYLAIACAVAALEAQKVQRIVLVRPVVEAGESLGFLPGDISEKIDPYLRPLYDALYEMLGFERVSKLMERHIIELAPLAYMRGRTLNDAFIILDESQNSTKEQMKMFLTRLGFGSTAVITGDITQIDLPTDEASGLRHAIQIFKDIPGMNFTFFDSTDIVRHPIVQKIVEAYEKHDKQSKGGR